MLKQVTLLIILLSTHQLANSEPIRSKNWLWDVGVGDYAYAATTNSSGRVLGQYCYYSSESCLYVVTLGVTCKEGKEHPSILNSNAGAVDVKLICSHKVRDGNAFVIKPFDDVDTMIKQASTISFAVAMENGTFKVVRFSLIGSTYAIEMMRAGTEVILNNKKKNNIRTRKPDERYL